jgi:ABC-type transporter MlaC component
MKGLATIFQHLICLNALADMTDSNVQVQSDQASSSAKTAAVRLQVCDNSNQQHAA